MEQIRKQITATTPIESHFRITGDTNIIIPAKHMNYDSIALEDNKVYPIRQIPLEIVKRACKGKNCDFTTKKRQSEIFYKDGYKLPISLNSDTILIAFPTKGINHMDCAWVIEGNIKYIEKHGEKSVVIFHNEQSVILDISIDVLENQCKKAQELYNFLFTQYEVFTQIVQEEKMDYRTKYRVPVRIIKKFDWTLKPE